MIHRVLVSNDRGNQNVTLITSIAIFLSQSVLPLCCVNRVWVYPDWRNQAITKLDAHIENLAVKVH